MPAIGGEAILCAIRGTGRTLDFALREARKTGSRLYLLFVREQAFMTEQDAGRKWQDDEEASRVLVNFRRPLVPYLVQMNRELGGIEWFIVPQVFPRGCSLVPRLKWHSGISLCSRYC